jgi:hypothetical protein
MPELSPAAQAVLDAYWKSPWDPSLQHEDRYAIAAALRAAADQVVPEPAMIVEGGRNYEQAWTATVHNDIRSRLLAIAAELKAHA